MEVKKLPDTVIGWKAIVKSYKLENQTIHKFEFPVSASKISLEQFLLLQVVWIQVRKCDSFIRPGDHSFLQQEFLDKAKAKLDAAEFWNKYLDSFRYTNRDLGRGIFPQIGTLTFVRDYQVQCDKLEVTDPSSSTPKFTPIAHRTRSTVHVQQQQLQTPTPASRSRPIIDPFSNMRLENASSPLKESTPESSSSEASEYLSPAFGNADLPPADDEQIVNTALLLLLRAMTMHFDVPALWSLKRRVFHFGEDKAKVFAAIVDGYLSSHNDALKAIIEVKPFTRGNDRKGICMQEAAQMAAWISSDPNPEQTGTFRYTLFKNLSLETPLR